MSIFNTTTILTGSPQPAAAKPAVIGSPVTQANLTYGVFYTGGPTFNATYGKFVKS